MSAYTSDELQRIEQTLGATARRTAVATVDLRQRHLEEFTRADQRRDRASEASILREMQEP